MTKASTLTPAQKRVVKIIGSRSYYAWPIDLEQRYPGYRRALNALIKKGRVVVRQTSFGEVYQLPAS